MPTYDYKCRDCGYSFEKFQSINARKLTKCPRCGGKVKRLIGMGAGIIFKGPGFYETDYRSENYKKGEKKEKENLASTESKPAGDASKSPVSTKKRSTSGDRSSSSPSKKDGD